MTLLHNSESLNVMQEALSRAGYVSPLDEAKRLLEQCWLEKRPDAEAAFGLFVENLRAQNPMLAAVADDGGEMGRVIHLARSFAIRHADWWRSAVNRAFSVQRGKSIAAHNARRGYSGKQNAVRLRRKEGMGEFREASALPKSRPIGPRDSRVDRQLDINHRKKDRERRGVALGTVEIDKRTGQIIALVSKLPRELAALEINAQRVLLLDMTAEEAAAWCERHGKYARVGLAWASRCPDPRKTLREQLTEEIVAEVNLLFHDNSAP